MAVCRFFLQGNCKFGGWEPDQDFKCVAEIMLDHCKNEHPSQRSAPFSSRNPFGPLQNTTSSQQGNSSRGISQGRNLPYKLDRNRIITDLKHDRPLYILSAYAPERELPVQLFGGYPREQSFEELRLRHYELAAAGNPQQAITEAQEWFKSAEEQIRTALNDIDGAIKFMINGENEHPNRIEICRARGTPSSLSRSGQTPQPFGQPASALSGPTSTFGAQSGSFGNDNIASGFGQPSTLGTQPAPFGQQTSSTSLFGQPGQLGRPTAAFGQPAFGQASMAGPAFDRPSNTPSSFTQPLAPTSTFGQASSQQSPFGQKIAPAFGAPSALGSNRQSPFGQAQAQPEPGKFGQGAPPSNNTGFGQPSAATTNPFDQPKATTSGPTSTGANPFARQPANQAANAFGQYAPPPNPFGQAAAQAAAPIQQPSGGPSSGFGQTPAPSSVPSANQSTALQPANDNERVDSTRDGQGKLHTWKGQRVTYVDELPCIKARDGGWEKISFPDGPPNLSKAAELPDSTYNQGVKENYEYVRQHGIFHNGIMPYLPPKRAWCRWNF